MPLKEEGKTKDINTVFICIIIRHQFLMSDEYSTERFGNRYPRPPYFKKSSRVEVGLEMWTVMELDVQY